MRIHVGIIGELVGWELLLKQEGIPYSAVEGDFSEELWSVLVVGDSAERASLRHVEEYLARGGAVLCSGKMFAQLTHLPVSETFVRTLIEEPNSMFAGVGLIDVFCKCHIPAGAEALRTDREHPAVFIGKHYGGHIVALPFDPSISVNDHRVETKSFYASRSRLPFERVSLVSKSSIRTLVVRSLELLHHHRGLPYVHTWYYPGDAKSIFSFRIDTDYGSREEIERLYALAKKYSVPMTWFVDVGSQHQFLDIFKNMEEQEVGMHCYEHKTFDDGQANIHNIGKAVERFREHNLTPKSFAAPFGRWNDGIAQAIEQFSFEYSSEFSYDYDNLPSFPLRTNGTQGALQIPVHPISIGGLRRQGCSEQEMIEYFARTLDMKLHSHEPIIFYHHPKDGNERVVESVWKSVRARRIPFMRMIDFARWWKKRIAANVAVEFANGTCTVATDQPDAELRLHITMPERKEAWLSNHSSGMKLDQIRWSAVPSPQELPADLIRIRKFNPWIPLIRMEDAIANILHPKHSINEQE